MLLLAADFSTGRIFLLAAEENITEKAYPAQNFERVKLLPAEYQEPMLYLLKSFADLENLVRLSL